MSIAENLDKIKQTLPQGVKLVAVSKFHPVKDISEAYDAGQRAFGESRMQEVDQKQSLLPKDIEWHFIGHLQTNKVKKIVPYVNTIHSVDSWKLIEEIEKQASVFNVSVNCLLEIHIAQEESKYGFNFESCRCFLKDNDWKSLQNVKIAGVMGMATDTDDLDQVRNEFRSLKKFFDELKNEHFTGYKHFKEVSMGMSHDYKIAIEEGATIVRIGTSIFGERI
ncbi:MAG: YggS family pyridoxal phosphate-dependent enzyme [Dysgonomonas sp.]